MKRVIATIAVVLVGVSSALGVPATRTPATQPAARGDRDVRPRVLVLPFEELSDAPQRAWVGKAMQDSLIAELTRSGLVAVITPPADAQPTKDAAAAAQLARDQHAPLAILGSYQLVGEELRVTGQMIESIDGEHIAAIKATGSLRDLFSIEDMIGSQVRRDLLAILQPESSQQPQDPRVAGRDPFGVEPSGPVQQQPPTGAYNGSDLQRSLYGDQWTVPVPADVVQGRNRARYDYPGYYYPPSYSYYDWSGYRPWRPSTGYGLPVVPAGPGPSIPIGPNNNYNNHPGQMGRPSGNTNYNTTPGQMGRSSGGSSVQSAPGQSGRSSGGRSNQVGSPGQSGRSSGGNTMQNSSSR